MWYIQHKWINVVHTAQMDKSETPTKYLSEKLKGVR
jgi:hypothetical protein